MISRKNSNKIASASRISELLIHAILMVISLICIVPLFLMISVAFSYETDIIKYGFRIIPHNFTLDAFRAIFVNPGSIITGYKNSGIVTFAGTFLGLVICSMYAYPISRIDFKYRKVLSFYIFVPMLFSAGLVPFYMLINRLGLNDTLWVLILPPITSSFNIFILRTNFQKIPISLIESAKIDGASEMRIYWTIILRLSSPVLATIGLFFTLTYWNEWFLALLYIDDSRLWPLQLLLKKLMDSIEFLNSDRVRELAPDLVRDFVVPSENARMAMALVAVTPLLLVYPFLQKFFVKGLTIGGVKG